MCSTKLLGNKEIQNQLEMKQTITGKIIINQY